MKRIIFSIVALICFLILPLQAQAANLPPIVPSCDQTTYKIKWKKETGTPTNGGITQVIESSEYDTANYPASDWNITEYSTTRNCELTDLLQVFVNLFSWGLYILSILGLLFLFIGGGTLMFSGGNEERVRTGKKVLVNTVIGIVVAMSSWVIVNMALAAMLSEKPGGVKNGIAYLVDNQPWFTISSDAPVCDPVAVVGCKSDLVVEFQAMLRDKGCYANQNQKTDGTYDIATRDAWFKFQLANGVTNPVERLSTLTTDNPCN
jgi:hypothetical protein